MPIHEIRPEMIMDIPRDRGPSSLGRHRIITTYQVTVDHKIEVETERANEDYINVRAVYLDTPGAKIEIGRHELPARIRLVERGFEIDKRLVERIHYCLTNNGSLGTIVEYDHMRREWIIKAA